MADRWLLTVQRHEHGGVWTGNEVSDVHPALWLANERFKLWRGATVLLQNPVTLLYAIRLPDDLPPEAMVALATAPDTGG